MAALAALVLTLAAAAAPALDDPGAGASAPIAASAAGNSAPATTTSAAAGPTTAPQLGADAIIGTPNIGTPTVGTPHIGAAATEADASHGFPAGPVLPLLGFALCGGAALVFARRKQQATPKMLEIVETHGLGGRRSLIVARIAGETVLLGASEAGLTLLLARPGETVTQAQPEAHRPGAAEAAAAPPASGAGALGSTWLGKLRLARSHDQIPEAKEPSFEELLALDAAARGKSRSAPGTPLVEPALLRQPLDPLAESAEDQELRRKLAQGRSGRIA